MRILKSFDLNRDYSVFPNCTGGGGRGGGQTPFFEKYLLEFNLLYPPHPPPKLRNWLKVPTLFNYYSPLTILTAPTILNVGLETLFRSA